MGKGLCLCRRHAEREGGMIPNPPEESNLTPEQRKALRRIQMLIQTHFHRGQVCVVFKGIDQQMRVQVISNCNTSEEALDLAQRTLQQVQISEQGIVTSLTSDERRIVK